MTFLTARKSCLHFLFASFLIALCASAASAQTNTKKTSRRSVKSGAGKPGGIAGAKPGAAGATSKTATTTSKGPTTSSPHGPTTGGAKTTTTGASTRTTGGAVGSKTAGGTLGGSKVAGAGTTSKMANGRPVPAGSHLASTPHGDQVRMRPGGRPADVHVAGRNMDIHNGLGGGRRVEVTRADHSRIVAERGGRGFVEHPYRYGGREYAHRSYYYGGRSYDRYYGHYYYGGMYVDYYTPAYYYRPAFYGWAYNPWAVPIAYPWGFVGNPWYGYYGAAYFTPYPVYASASLWLTDYLISQSLQAAYQAQVAAAAQSQALAAGAAGLTPEVKDLISAEVQRQIALENAEAQTAQAAAPDPASSSIQRMLTDNVQHIFVVGQNLDLINTASNGECAVSQGDALQLTGPPASDATAATLVVLSSKGGVECPKTAIVQVQISDLQEMQNHMRETIDAGMGEIKSKQGSSLPALPASASGEPVKATFVSAAPPPDPNVSAEINQQLQAADQAQNQVVAEVPADGANQQLATGAPPADAPPPPVAASAPAAAPASIELGQSIDDVTAAMGQPIKIVDLGLKKIYVYKDIKVTFKSGKVSDVQ